MDSSIRVPQYAKRSISTFGTPATLRNTNNMTSLININLVQHDPLHHTFKQLREFEDSTRRIQVAQNKKIAVRIFL
jgi:hypothetical protein